MRSLKERSAQPVLQPKNKALRMPVTGSEVPAAAGEPAPEKTYAAAKLRTETLGHAKVYCALRHHQMQDFMSDAVDAALRAAGYLPPLPPQS